MPDRSRTARLGFCALGLAIALAGCRSTPEPNPLPLHVAFMPVEVRENGAEDADLRLDLTPDSIADGLQRGLAGRAFHKVTQLELADSSTFAPQGREQERLWQERAATLGADVLVRTKVVYDPIVSGQINEKFWLNLPLFLFAWPLSWAIDDRSYEGRARLQAEFFDLADLHEVLDEDARLLEFPILGEFSGASFDLLSRAGKNVPSYALSFLLPAGLLARSTETVDERIDTAAVDALVADLVSKIQQERLEFLNNDLATFHIVESETVVERASDGSVQLTVSLNVSGAAGLRDFALSSGDKELLRGALDGSPDARGRVWIREGSVRLSGDTEYLRLRIVDALGGRRSYTLRITEAPE